MASSPARTICTAWPPVRAPSARTGLSLRISSQRRSAPSRASVCSSTTEPRRRTTSSAVYVRSMPLQRSSACHCASSSRAASSIISPPPPLDLGSQIYPRRTTLHLLRRKRRYLGSRLEAVVPVDDLGHADGLVAALAFDRRGHRYLAAPILLVDGSDDERAAHPRARGHRRGEAHAIEPVVERHACARLVVGQHLVRHLGEQREREVPEIGRAHV